jgi:hypothetical protein
MPPKSVLRKFGSSVFLAGLTLLPSPALWSAFAGVQQERESSQQQPSPPEQSSQAQPPPPVAKTKRVWTNEEVISLRTPADTYQEEKEAQEAAAAQAAAKEAAEAKPVKEAGPAIELPSTVEETLRLIKAKQDQIDDEQSALERLVKELPNTPEDQKTAMQMEVHRVTADLPKVRQELKTLQTHLEKLTKAQPNEAAPPPAASSST